MGLQSERKIRKTKKNLSTNVKYEDCMLEKRRKLCFIFIKKSEKLSVKEKIFKRIGC
jgi:hypothetical protein